MSNWRAFDDQGKELGTLIVRIREPWPIVEAPHGESGDPNQRPKDGPCTEGYVCATTADGGTICWCGKK